jgi:hypothetical protein
MKQHTSVMSLFIPLGGFIDVIDGFKVGHCKLDRLTGENDGIQRA